MTDAPDPKTEAKARALRIARWAALIGGVLAVVCHFLPQNYRALCQAVANICTGG